MSENQLDFVKKMLGNNHYNYLKNEAKKKNITILEAVQSGEIMSTYVQELNVKLGKVRKAITYM